MAYNVTADSLDGDGIYAQKNFSVESEIWVQVKVTFPLTTINATIADTANNPFLLIADEFGSWNQGAEMDYIGPGVQLQIHSSVTIGTDNPFVPVAATQYLCELHLTSNGAVTPYDWVFYVDGAVVQDGTALARQGWTAAVLGWPFGTTTALHVTYEDLRVGTTRHGTDVFADDFSSGSFGTYDDVFVDPPDAFTFGGSAPPAGIEGICIAFDDPTLEPDPTWTRIDSTDNFVASATIDRGRSFELDRMDTGRATLRINDTDGTLDPTNTTGPYFGKIEPLLQVAIALHDPVADTWTTIYRGFIDDYSYDADPSQQINFLTLSCVDAFEILTAIEMLPDGTFGDSPSTAETGNIVFAAANVDDRIFQALSNAGWPSTLATVFSGNVSVQRTVYSPGQSILEVIQEAADAEFPGLAVVYVSAEGKVTFHGRKAKFDPVGVAAGAGGAWTFTHWKSGDGTAVNASPTDTAHIRGISGNRGLSKIINSALAAPKGIKPTALAGQVVTDSTSIGIFGVRSWSATDLITEGGLNDSLNADDETQLFAQYYVDNYKVARDRISQLTFKSMWTDGTGAGATWDLLCNAELSDLIDVTVDYPGGGGFTAEPFFIEGIHYEIGPGTPDFWMVTKRLDVSPQAYFTSSPFTGDT
jgi:hypothetical protein